MSGGYWVKFNKAGESDIWLIYRGLHVECEIKRPGEKPTAIQISWMNLCNSHGAKAFWVDSLEGFIKEMSTLATCLDSYWDKH